MLFLQSFYVRSLLSGVNDNPSIKTSWFSNHEVLLSIRTLYLYLTSMFIKTFTVELNLLSKFSIWGVSFVAKYIYQITLNKNTSYRQL